MVGKLGGVGHADEEMAHATTLNHASIELTLS